MCVGAVIQTTSFGLAQLIVGRIVTGIGWVRLLGAKIPLVFIRNMICEEKGDRC